jgi:hypothetical protein
MASVRPVITFVSSFRQPSYANRDLYLSNIGAIMPSVLVDITPRDVIRGVI